MVMENRARELIFNYSLPNDIELWPGTMLTPEDIAASLCFLLSVQYSECDPQTLSPLASRVYGLPHLPTDIEWPKDTYFAAQLNLEEIAQFKLWKNFPGQGTVYLFFNPMADDFCPFSPTACTPYITNNQEKRSLCKIPADKDLPDQGKYYKDEFFRTTFQLHFQPKFSLDFIEHLPESLIKELEQETGAQFLDRTQTNENSIGGAPITWNGEDAESLFAPEDWDWSKDAPPDPDRFLLFQEDFIDGTVHFWIANSDLREMKLTQIDTTYSGT